MVTPFYIAAAIAVLATGMVIVRANVVHALLYLLVSLLAVAMVLYLLGAPYAAAMEIIIYAGAVLILFVFVIMMVSVSAESIAEERRWLRPGVWPGPVLLGAALLAELVYVLLQHPAGASVGGEVVGPVAVGEAMFGPYLLGVELMSMVLLAGLVGAYHLARRHRDEAPAREKPDRRAGEEAP